MRILVFTTTYLPLVGGAEIAIAEIAKGLPEVCFDVVTARMRPDLPKKEIMGNVTVYRLGFGNFFDKYILALSGSGFAKKNIEKKPDLIWAMMASYGGLAASFFKKKNAGIPYLLSLQEGDDLSRLERKTFFIRPFFLSIFKKADAIQVISNYLASWAKKMNPDVPVFVIPNGVDLPDVFHPRIKYAEEVRLISLSRLVYKNGLDILIKSLSHLPDTVSLVLVGGGPDKEKLRRLVDRNGLNARVCFAGEKEPVQALKFLNEADIFVRPSRSEGLGNAFLEAMASGLITVGTSVGGIPDFLKDGQTGFLVAKNTPGDLAKKIINIISLSEKERIKIIKSARDLVIESFTWNRVIREIQTLFSHLVDEKTFSLVSVPTGLYAPEVGGPATFVSFLEKKISKRGFRIIVIPFSKVRHLPKIARHFLYTWHVYKKSKKADVIFAQDPVSVGVPAFLASILLGKPFVLKIVGDYAWEQAVGRLGYSKSLDIFLNDKKAPFKALVLKKIERAIALRALKIVVPSVYLKNIVLRWGVPVEKVKVVYNAAPSIEIDKNKENVKQKLNISGTVIFSAGRLVPWKGFDTLIRAFAEIASSFPDVFLYIAGGGPDFQKLHDLREEYGLKERVFFVGECSKEELFMHLSASDIFIILSGYEGLSHQLLEAMAFGLPIIATDIDGNRELIEDNISGLLVPYQNIQETSSAVSFLLKNKDKRESLGKEAFAKASLFTEEEMIKNIAEFLRT